MDCIADSQGGSVGLGVNAGGPNLSASALGFFPLPLGPLAWSVSLGFPFLDVFLREEGLRLGDVVH